MIQLYGDFGGALSHAQVSRGIAYGLYTNGLRDLQLMDVGNQGLYEGLSEPIVAGGYGISLATGFGEAPIGFYIGGYPPQMQNWLEGHQLRVALFIAESSRVPKTWAAVANSLDLCVVPSAWVRDAFIAAGARKEVMMVVPHGIHPLYMFARARPPSGTPLQLLHICGSRDFPQRKGTPQLVEAFRQVFQPGEARLTLRVPPNTEEVRAVALGCPDVILEESYDSRPPLEQIAYYLQGWDAVIQPSRAEAFGIVPVEARACGLPVITTHCSGHLEHATPRDVVVNHGPEAHLRCNGIPSGAAPAVTVEAIAEALRRWRSSRRWSDRDPQYARGWQWPDVCRKLAAKLRDMLRETKGPRSLNVI